MQKPLLTKEQIIFWFHRFRGIDTTMREHRQRLIDFFINGVYLYDDRFVITFNYKDGTKTVMLEDIEKEFGSDFSASGAPASRQVHDTHGLVSFFTPLVRSAKQLVQDKRPTRFLNALRQV